MYGLLKVLCYEMSFDKPNCKLEIKSFQNDLRIVYIYKAHD